MVFIGFDPPFGVRVCLHAGNTKEDVEGLASAVVRWAQQEVNLSSHSANADVLRPRWQHGTGVSRRDDLVRLGEAKL